MDFPAGVLSSLVGWARTRPDILGLALVGSHARGEATAGSDVDIVILTTDPAMYRASHSWLDQIDWPGSHSEVISSRDQDYGQVWSRHLRFADGSEVELSFAPASWASTQPVDSGTLAVVRDGCRIIWDPEELLSRLLAASQ